VGRQLPGTWKANECEGGGGGGPKDDLDTTLGVVHRSKRLAENKETRPMRRQNW
jgi:hypothetical protein